MNQDQPNKYHRLTVLEDLGVQDFGSYKKRTLACLCECGEVKELLASRVWSGHTKSCGCLMREVNRAMRLKHGMKGTKEYTAWKATKQRTRPENSPCASGYALRGITRCKRWSGPRGFENFFADMGPAPSPTHSVERLNNDLGYSPENCIWATRTQQNRNTRQNIFIEHLGFKRALAEWAELYGLKASVLRERIKAGMELSRALCSKDLRFRPGINAEDT